MKVLIMPALQGVFKRKKKKESSDGSQERSSCEKKPRTSQE